jgi:beta-glucosidase
MITFSKGEPVKRFPPGFLWGVSTSAFQIEGALAEGGRGPSIWDRFCAAPGRIARGETAEIACDHYHRVDEDLALLADLGVGAYRFSIAWPRVQPAGHGPANAAGLDFYERLVDGLLARGIEPLPTLYHWDLPQALQEGGGWMNRATAQRFAEFVQLVVRRLGDRVPRWITHNETFEHAVFGHALGTHAPGLELGLGLFPVVHHLLLSHGLAVQALRAAAPAAQVGIAQSLAPARPATGAAADVEAAALLDSLHLGLHIEPLLWGRYPELPMVDPTVVQAGDLETIAQPLDFLGINFYNANIVRAAPPDAPVPIVEAEPPAGVERTDMGWPVLPESFTEALVGLKARFGERLPPILITENGAALPEERQIAYLESHLQALQRAMDAGVDVRGYCVWSLLDNFEWAEGYRPRFGLVHVDWATQRRTPKASYRWYRALIEAQQ